QAQAPATETPPAQEQAPNQEQALAQTQAQPQPNAEAEELRQQVAELRALQGAAAAPPQQPAQPERNYNFQIPQPLFDALNSEDPVQRQNGLVTIMNGVAEVIHNTVLQRVQAAMQQLMEQVPQAAAAQAQSVQERTAAAN